MNNVAFMKCKTHPNGGKKKCGNDMMWWEYNIYAVAKWKHTKHVNVWYKVFVCVLCGKCKNEQNYPSDGEQQQRKSTCKKYVIRFHITQISAIYNTQPKLTQTTTSQAPHTKHKTSQAKCHTVLPLVWILHFSFCESSWLYNLAI